MGIFSDSEKKICLHVAKNKYFQTDQKRITGNLIEANGMSFVFTHVNHFENSKLIQNAFDGSFGIISKYLSLDTHQYSRPHW